MITLAGPRPATEPPPPAAAVAAPAGPARAWPRVALACALLAVAGGVRAWQGRQVAAMMERDKFPPFRLATLPKEFGPWRATDDRVLDPEIARGAGSTDSVSRTYADDRTGVQIGLLVLYGSALQMHIHSPEACYPASGYTKVEGPRRRVVTYRRRDGSEGRAEVATLVYTRGEGPAAERKQVTYAWGHNGRWSPDLLSPKAYQRLPGMFKVHIDRRSVPGEALDVDNPGEALLKDLLPEMEARMHAGAGGPAVAAAAPR